MTVGGIKEGTAETFRMAWLLGFTLALQSATLFPVHNVAVTGSVPVGLPVEIKGEVAKPREFVKTTIEDAPPGNVPLADPCTCGGRMNPIGDPETGVPVGESNCTVIG
jgi:hypothetical protein